MDELEGIPVINLHLWFDKKLTAVSSPPPLLLYGSRGHLCYCPICHFFFGICFIEFARSNVDLCTCFSSVRTNVLLFKYLCYLNIHVFVHIQVGILFMLNAYMLFAVNLFMLNVARPLVLLKENTNIYLCFSKKEYIYTYTHNIYESI